MTEYLENLKLNPEFQKVLQMINEQRPVIPLHRHDPDNTAEWVALSNQQRGFDLCMSLFGVEND